MRRPPLHFKCACCVYAAVFMWAYIVWIHKTRGTVQDCFCFVTHDKQTVSTPDKYVQNVGLTITAPTVVVFSKHGVYLFIQCAYLLLLLFNKCSLSFNVHTDESKQRKSLAKYCKFPVIKPDHRPRRGYILFCWSNLHSLNLHCRKSNLLLRTVWPLISFNVRNKNCWIYHKTRTLDI